MIKVEYTKQDLDEFRDLVECGESQNQLARIKNRLEMPKFIAKHGKEKCDTMFVVLCEELKPVRKSKGTPT